MCRRLLYLQYTSPANYPPLEQSGVILRRAGWEVRYFGIVSEGESSKLIFPEPLAGRVTLWKRQASGWRQKVHFLGFGLWALGWALWWRPNWVYCSDLMSCPAAWLIGKLTRTRVLYHEHDSPTSPKAESRKQKAENVAEKQKAESREQETEVRSQKSEAGKPTHRNTETPATAFQLFLLWFRQQVGREADLVVFPNAKRLEIFVSDCGRTKPSQVVFNCPRKEEAQRPKPEIGNRKSEIGNGEDGVLRLAFHGSINRDRLPLALLPALAQFRGAVQLQIVGYTTVGMAHYLADFLAEARRLGLQEAVEFLGAMPRQPMMQTAAHCAVGLAFMPLAGGDVNMEHMTGASNKPFDYLACGLALLVSARPDWEAMFVQPGYGRACDPFDAAAIAAQLQWFLEHPTETRELGERGRQRILSEWNYEEQFAKVVNSL